MFVDQNKILDLFKEISISKKLSMEKLQKKMQQIFGDLTSFITEDLLKNVNGF